MVQPLQNPSEVEAVGVLTGSQLEVEQREKVCVSSLSEANIASRHPPVDLSASASRVSPGGKRTARREDELYGGRRDSEQGGGTLGREEELDLCGVAVGRGGEGEVKDEEAHLPERHHLEPPRVHPDRVRQVHLPRRGEEGSERRGREGTVSEGDARRTHRQQTQLLGGAISLLPAQHWPALFPPPARADLDVLEEG
eukprot:2893142-Rhodomonas_salina.1